MISSSSCCSFLSFISRCKRVPRSSSSFKEVDKRDSRGKISRESRVGNWSDGGYYDFSNFFLKG